MPLRDTISRAVNRARRTAFEKAAHINVVGALRSPAGRKVVGLLGGYPLMWALGMTYPKYYTHTYQMKKFDRFGKFERQEWERRYIQKDSKTGTWGVYEQRSAFGYFVQGSSRESRLAKDGLSLEDAINFLDYYETTRNAELKAYSDALAASDRPTVQKMLAEKTAATALHSRKFRHYRANIVERLMDNDSTYAARRSDRIRSFTPPSASPLP